ncbi:MAG: bifunctional diguanylate cyclase/phosphodiesterase, partial [Beggiatoa sp.]|nr:bifunctional diguanylate cyclase/phosphodiesterase [Beggiatoa sp.]
QDRYTELWQDAYRAGAPCDWPVEVIHAYADAVTQWLIQLTSPASDLWMGIRTLHRLVGYHSRIISLALCHYEKTGGTEYLLQDPVTALPNRVAFLEDLKRWTSRGGAEMAVIAMHFQDVVGPVSDRDDQWRSFLVRQIAERCRGGLRDQDVVARIGWNEFAFILPAIKGEGHALLACERISRILRESFQVDGLRTLVRPTLGIGLFPRHAQEAEPLLRMAELARNEAAAHKRPIVVYSESLGRTLRERRAVEREFETALQDNAVLVYFQPQISLVTGRAMAAEALVRWRNRRGELVAPDEILAACENVGLNWSLTTFMINTALRHCADWARQGWDLAVSVNLTASDLAEPELPDFVNQALGLWGVPADKLTLEITEDSLIRDISQTMTTLADVKALAVGLSIDDFGTGYSSLAYLKRLPIDELKIDRGFVSNMLGNRHDRMIVKAVIDLAHRFDLRVVAEGAEDRETIAAIEACGGDLVQRYHISRPCRPRGSTIGTAGNMTWRRARRPSTAEPG